MRNLKQTFKEGIREIYIGKDEIIVDKKFEDLGFTDSGLVEASKNKCLLTSDENLYLYARNRGINAKHSNEIFFKPGK